MLLHFPQMHPECVPGGPVSGVLFFNPRGGEADEQCFTPSNLPLNSEAASRLLDDCIRFGEQFVKPGEMAAFGRLQSKDGRSESSSALERELRQRLAGESASTGDSDAHLAKAQFLLLLAWAFEERAMELQGLSHGIAQAWNQFGGALGVDDADSRDQAELQLGNVIGNTQAPAVDAPTLPWQMLLEAVCVFLPETAVLVVRDLEMVSFMEELDLEWSSMPELADKGIDAQGVEVPAWRVLGLSNAPAERPFLSRSVRLAVVPCND